MWTRSIGQMTVMDKKHNASVHLPHWMTFGVFEKLDGLSMCKERHSPGAPIPGSAC